MKLEFDKYADGLIPSVVQDATTGDVLMLGFVNSEALSMTESTGRVTFFSRSKQRLWTKGETSGNFLEVVSITPDCDNDTLLIKARPTGPVCHAGTATCFGEPGTDLQFLIDLERVIADRRTDPKEDSYVSRLFSKGLNKVAQKVGEEAVETVIAAKDDEIADFKNEAADLFFHYLILLQAKGLRLNDIVSTLRERKK